MNIVRYHLLSGLYLLITSDLLSLIRFPNRADVYVFSRRDWLFSSIKKRHNTVRGEKVQDRDKVIFTFPALDGCVFDTRRGRSAKLKNGRVHFELHRKFRPKTAMDLSWKSDYFEGYGVRFSNAGHLCEKENYQTLREKGKDADGTDFRTENRRSIAERSHWQC